MPCTFQQRYQCPPHAFKFEDNQGKVPISSGFFFGGGGKKGDNLPSLGNIVGFCRARPGHMVRELRWLCLPVIHRRAWGRDGLEREIASLRLFCGLPFNSHTCWVKKNRKKTGPGGSSEQILYCQIIHHQPPPWCPASQLLSLLIGVVNTNKDSSLQKEVSNPPS